MLSFMISSPAFPRESVNPLVSLHSLSPTLPLDSSTPSVSFDVCFVLGTVCYGSFVVGDSEYFGDSEN